MSSAVSRWYDPWLTALAPLIWGSTYVVTTEFLPPDVPLLSAALRTLPVGLLMLLWLRQLPDRGWWGKIFLLGFLNIGVFQALLFVAAYRLPGGVAATVGAIQPLVVVILSWAVLGARTSWLSWIAAVSGMLGVALLVLGPAAKLDGLGIIAAAGGALAMACGTLLTKRWQPPVNALVLTSWQLSVGGLFLLPLALSVESLPQSINLTQVLGYLWLGLIGTGLTYVFWLRGVMRMSASAVTGFSLLSPLSATVLGLVLLDQQLTWLQSVGMVLVLTGVWLGQYKMTAAVAPVTTEVRR
ncbi:EamA family transporter [Rheinheimera tangshanensis]|uniref:EamA family transporter n=1 Tax=Rheinheimera tangshanensis TaxID=400153 RepID=A0A5C8LVZ6_9GAMM|nr:EamA family transporter [Rheinheimera tangshanensis]TXK80867.1 EamA family transporter [Rheinheimera tangshanensis]GGM63455.1 ABC transporter permease [Rheinheimera tangshanensis]